MTIMKIFACLLLLAASAACAANAAAWFADCKLVTPRQPRQTKSKARPQDVAARKLAAARKKVEEKLAIIRRATELLYEWEKRARRYEWCASMTDEEVAAERTRRVAATEQCAANRRRRGIKLAKEHER